MAKKKAKKQPQQPVQRTPQPGETARTPDGQAVVFTPNTLEIFWEKYNKHLYGLAIALVTVWAVVWLSRYLEKQEREEVWNNICVQTDFIPDGFMPKSAFDRAKDVDPANMSSLIKEREGTPEEPWLRFIEARHFVEVGEYATAKEKLGTLKKDFPQAEVCNTKVPYGFHEKEMAPVDALFAVMAEIEAGKKKYSFFFENPAPSDVITAVVTTDRGAFKLRFYPEMAPKHVTNFCKLVQKGYFDGIKVHKVSIGGDNYTSTFFEFGDAQTRDPKSDRKNWGTESGDHQVIYEKNRLFHFKGVLAAVRKAGEKKTSGTMVRILGDKHSAFDGLLNIFGQVIEGMEIVEGIVADVEFGGNPGTKEGVPMNPPVIEKIELTGDLAKLGIPLKKTIPAPKKPVDSPDKPKIPADAPKKDAPAKPVDEGKKKAPVK